MKWNRSSLLYELLLCFLTIDAAIYNTIISDALKEPFHQICLMIVLCLAVLCLFSKEYTRTFLIGNIVILLFALLSYGISGNTDIFTSILLVMLAWKIDINSILKTIFNIRIVVFVGAVALSIIGVLDAGSIVTSSADKGVLLGYGHANTFAGNVLGLSTFAVYSTTFPLYLSGFSIRSTYQMP